MREGTQASGREITCLRDYLAMIHPGWDFVINEKIPVKIQQ